MKRKKILGYASLSLLLLIAVAALYVSKEYNRVHKDTADLKPDYSVIAPELINEFLQDEKSANQKYWDRVIRVKGFVRQIERDENGFYSVVLGDSTSLSSVRCTLDSSHSRDAALIEKGKNATLKGICAGFNADELLGLDVILVRSVFDNK